MWYNIFRYPTCHDDTSPVVAKPIHRRPIQRIRAAPKDTFGKSFLCVSIDAFGSGIDKRDPKIWPAECWLWLFSHQIDRLGHNRWFVVNTMFLTFFILCTPSSYVGWGIRSGTVSRNSEGEAATLFCEQAAVFASNRLAVRSSLVYNGNTMFLTLFFLCTPSSYIGWGIRSGTVSRNSEGEAASRFCEQAALFRTKSTGWAIIVGL